MLQCMSETIQQQLAFFFTLKQTLRGTQHFLPLPMLLLFCLFFKAVMYISEKLSVPMLVFKQTQLCTMTAMVHLTYCISCLHVEVVPWVIVASANVVVVGFRKPIVCHIGTSMCASNSQTRKTKPQR